MIGNDEDLMRDVYMTKAQREAYERLRKNDERYRWLRDSLLAGDDLQALTDMPEPENADEFDAAIDAAMQGANTGIKGSREAASP